MSDKYDYLEEYIKKEMNFAKYTCNCNDFGFRLLYGVCGSCLRFPWAKYEMTEQLIAEKWKLC